MTRETSCDQHVDYVAGCPDCKLRNKAWRDRNRQRIRDQQNARWARLKDSINTRRRERHAANPEINLRQMRNWRKKNPERWQEIGRDSYYRHHESRKQRLRDGYKKFRSQRRLAAKLELQRLRVQALNSLGGKCVVCGVTDPRILNINHLYGGGTAEHVANKRAHRRFYKKVIMDPSLRSRLDVRCYNHNLLFEYETGRRFWLLSEKMPLTSNPIMRRRYQYQLKRVELTKYLGGRCVTCGETDVRILTVNHIGGGGTHAFHSATSENQYYTDILTGKIPRQDLDLRCMNHNILYDYEMGRRTWLLDSKTGISTETDPTGQKMSGEGEIMGTSGI